MLEIGKTIVSFDVLEKCFCCDIATCKGCCCIEGDSGAPLNDEEIEILHRDYDKISPYMNEAGRQAIAKSDVYYIDEEHDKVTTLVDGAACAFVIEEDGITKCAIEKAYLAGATDFRKPISCHLYPIRIHQYRKFDAVNYDEWKICDCARTLGEKLNLKVVDFLKEPLIRKYGEEWYNELKQVNDAWQKEKMKQKE